MRVRLRVATLLALIATFWLSPAALAAPAAQEAPASPDAPLGSGFTFQGRLDKAGTPVTASCAMSFDLWDASAGGAQVGATQNVNPVAVAEGLFTVVLNQSGQFGATAFNGQARFLETAVQCPGDASPVTLPRQQLTAAPYALTALSANALQGRPVAATAPAAGQVLGWNGSAWVPSAAGAQGPAGPTGPQGPSGPAGTTDWNGLTNVPAGFADDIDNEGWELDGNAGTTPASRLGTTDMMTLTVMVSNTTALRILPRSHGSTEEFAPNLVGGVAQNLVGPGVQGAVIGGGGRVSAGSLNEVYDSYGTIAGGLDNVVGTNDGINLHISGSVGGGFSNDLPADFGVIAGGRQNNVSATHGSVGGGQGNEVRAGSDYGVIPGGLAAATTMYGQVAHASGQFNNVGDAQASEYLLRNATNGVAAQELYLDCNEVTNTNLDSGTPCASGDTLTVSSGRALAFEIRIVAYVMSPNGTLPDAASVAFFGAGLLRNKAGVTTLAEPVSLTEIGDPAGETALGATVTANDAQDRLAIAVSSTQGGVVRWIAWVQAVELAE